jgi:hypothetical protein
MNDLAKTLSDMIPKSLDDGIRANRHLVQLRLATDQELIAIADKLSPGPVKDELSDYRLVSILTWKPETVFVHLLGTCSAGHSWATSGVIRLDMMQGYALTRTGSLYKLLGERRRDEPGGDDLICLCAIMNQWGLGKLLGLPPFHF